VGVAVKILRPRVRENFARDLEALAFFARTAERFSAEARRLRLTAATIAPMSLLVPVFGFASSALILHESLELWKIGATLLIMAGLAVNLLWRPRKTVIRGEAC